MTMMVKVNRTTVEIFEGARVRHAVLRYLVKRHNDATLIDRVVLRDAAGHRIGLDAPLAHGQLVKCTIHDN